VPGAASERQILWNDSTESNRRFRTVARKRKLTPSYLEHKQSGRGRLVWTDHLGNRQQKLLPGAYNSPESLAAKARLELELATSPAGALSDKQDISVAEVMLAFLAHAQAHYRRDDGTPTNEVEEYRIVACHVSELYGLTLAASFGPLALKAVRQRFIDAGWCRRFINQRVGRVKHIFKWAVAEELVPPSVHHALSAVQGLQRGRTNARESEPVGPVDEATVEATLPHLNRYARGMVEFQRLTGCRPGEACLIRRCDVDTGGTVWLYRPRQHKTAWRGKARVVAIGPKAQEVLKQFFTPDIHDYLFSPRRAVEELIAERATNRKTPRYPSHMKRNAQKRKGTGRKRAPAERYNRLSYLTAVTRACNRAFPPPEPLARRKDETTKEWKARLTAEQKSDLARWWKAHRWHPNQLRHTFATRVRKQHGLEAAQVLLGHARADVTQVYAERNEQLAASVAVMIG
jgi:integrase